MRHICANVDEDNFELLLVHTVKQKKKERKKRWNRKNAYLEIANDNRKLDHALLHREVSLRAR